jgi:hypothetical protein
MKDTKRADDDRPDLWDWIVMIFVFVLDPVLGPFGL